MSVHDACNELVCIAVELDDAGRADLLAFARRLRAARSPKCRRCGSSELVEPATGWCSRCRRELVAGAPT